MVEDGAPPNSPDESSPDNDPAQVAAWRRMQHRHRQMLIAEARRNSN